MDGLTPRSSVCVAGWAGTAIVGGGTLPQVLNALRADAVIVGVGWGKLFVEEGKEVVVGDLGEL